MTTKLEAVNEILESIGESTINSLVFEQSDGSINQDAAMALRILERETKRVLSRGWWFNRDDRFRLKPDDFGTILLPGNTLSIEEADTVRDQYVRRANRLYNRTKQTFYFPHIALCRIVWAMPIDAVPEVCASYITIRSVRLMADKVMTDQVLHAFTQADEDKALLALTYAENEQLDANVFKTPDMADALDRNPDYPPYWLN